MLKIQHVMYFTVEYKNTCLSLRISKAALSVFHFFYKKTSFFISNRHGVYHINIQKQQNTPLTAGHGG